MKHWALWSSWLIAFGFGILTGFVWAHAMPHDMTAPAWERARRP